MAPGRIQHARALQHSGLQHRAGAPTRRGGQAGLAMLVLALTHRPVFVVRSLRPGQPLVPAGLMPGGAAGAQGKPTQQRTQMMTKEVREDKEETQDTVCGTKAQPSGPTVCSLGPQKGKHADTERGQIDGAEQDTQDVAED